MHLIVVQHGLWGMPANTAYLCDLLCNQLGPGYHVLNSNVNSGNLTYDGIDLCGDRLHALVLDTIKALAAQQTPVTAISLIGYSMGGLVTRYLAGKLFAEGLFDTVTPINFITIATPHLGSWRMPTTWLNRAFNYLVPVVTSRSGLQLMLQDKHEWGKPLLCLMSHPDLLFVRALRRFKRLALYANVFHDRPVPYCTAAIRLDNPYELSKPVPVDPKYPSIVTTEAAAATAAAAAAAREGAKIGDGSGAAVPSGAGAGGQQAAPPPQRPLRSTYLRVFWVIALPLAVPALLLMVATGRSHRCKIQRAALDFSWITKYHRGEYHCHAAGPDGEGGAARTAPEARQQGAAGRDADDEREGRLPSDIECPSAPDLPTATSAQAAGAAAVAAAAGNASAAANTAAGAGGGGARAAAALPSPSAAATSLTSAASLDTDGEDEVVISEQAVLLHDGIVELPAELHRMQGWLVDQLNSLPWTRVDVDCRDLHAHAAIVMRNPRRFRHCRDAMDHLAHTFLRA
ncbi:hypothetical protein GPECTOR_11g209 [Gonium pectorale]|uniref:DUF676 domain-containing protein n=1 Tax=Gonium pectorale TaxID=33097 RepID=A0A150GPN5_GONPE|nr:hypothetical protein GPECTOR_11g209 [Gonium pectorale]|eukprot:KXZ51765.1 hypothetical protein GPECTOR_11g209 [Gonium pectorale]